VQPLRSPKLFKQSKQRLPRRLRMVASHRRAFPKKPGEPSNSDLFGVLRSLAWQAPVHPDAAFTCWPTTPAWRALVGNELGDRPIESWPGLAPCPRQPRRPLCTDRCRAGTDAESFRDTRQSPSPAQYITHRPARKPRHRSMLLSPALAPMATVITGGCRLYLGPRCAPPCGCCDLCCGLLSSLQNDEPLDPCCGPWPGFFELGLGAPCLDRLTSSKRAGSAIEFLAIQSWSCQSGVTPVLKATPDLEFLESSGTPFPYSPSSTQVGRPSPAAARQRLRTAFVPGAFHIGQAFRRLRADTVLLKKNSGGTPGPDRTPPHAPQVDPPGPAVRAVDGVQLPCPGRRPLRRSWFGPRISRAPGSN